MFAVAQENFHPFNLEFVGLNKNKVVGRIKEPLSVLMPQGAV